MDYRRLRKLREQLEQRPTERYNGKVKVKGAPLSAATVNRYMAVASAVLSVAVGEGWLEKHPFPRDRRKRAALIAANGERPRERILTAAEEARLLEACAAPKPYRKTKEGGQRAGRKSQSEESPRRHLRPILIALIDTGMRWSELKGLTWRDVDMKEGLIRIRATHTKTLKKRVVGITDRLAVELKALREHSSSADDLVFGIVGNVRRAYLTARKIAGLEDLRLHDLRHTAATRMIQRGGAAQLVGRILGHAKVETTYRYTNADAEIARAAARTLNTPAVEENEDVN